MDAAALRASRLRLSERQQREAEEEEGHQGLQRRGHGAAPGAVGGTGTRLGC